MSRSDFQRDCQKLWRREQRMAIGAMRYYMVPVGMLNVSEICEPWGLLEVDGNCVRRTKKPLDIDAREAEGVKKEMAILVSALRRTSIRISPETLDDYLKLEESPSQIKSLYPRDFSQAN